MTLRSQQRLCLKSVSNGAESKSALSMTGDVLTPRCQLSLLIFYLFSYFALTSWRGFESMAITAPSSSTHTGSSLKKNTTELAEVSTLEKTGEFAADFNKKKPRRKP